MALHSSELRHMLCALQVEDKMQLLKSAVNLSDKAYKHPEAVKHLAGLLGLTGRGAEVSMCVGAAALQHDDVEAAQQTCLQLIRQDHASAWRLCAAVMRSGGDEVGSRDTHIQLLSFAAHYCPARRVSGCALWTVCCCYDCDGTPCCVETVWEGAERPHDWVDRDVCIA